MMMLMPCEAIERNKPLCLLFTYSPCSIIASCAEVTQVTSAETPSPNYSETMYFTPRQCAELMDSYDRVATPSETSCEDEQEEAIPFLSLGAASFAQGQTEKSIDFFKKAADCGKRRKDKEMEVRAYANLAVVLEAGGNEEEAIQFSVKALDLVKTVEVTGLKQRCLLLNKQGILYHNMSDFKESIRCHEESLEISKQISDKQGEAMSYFNLGTVYCTLGDYDRSIENHQECFKRRQEMGDYYGVGISYMQLAYLHYKKCNYQESVKYQEEALKISKETDLRGMESTCYSNLGCLNQANAQSLRAFEYYERSLCSSQTPSERKTFREMSRICYSIGDHTRATLYQERSFVSDENRNEFICSSSDNPLQEEIFEVIEEMEGNGNHRFLVKRKGRSYSSQLNVSKSTEVSSLESIKLHEELRQSLDDETKLSLDNQCVSLYKTLASQYISDGKPNSALFVLERGRAPGLNDLLAETYALDTTARRIQSDTLKSLTQKQKCCFLFMACLTKNLSLWFIDKEGKLTMEQYSCTDPRVKSTQDFLETQTREILATMKTEQDYLYPNKEKDRERRTKRDLCLRRLYKAIIAPVAELIEGHEEMVIVPEGQMSLIPFSCLQDKDGRYLSEKVRIRISPSLTTLNLIQDSPADYHSQVGELIVGVPLVGVKGLRPLECAKKEAEMIASLFGVPCLVGEQATKEEVLRRIGEVRLVHIATHGSEERGEPALRLRPSHSQEPPMLEDFVLTVEEIASLKIRAKLVVLSFCYGARGKLMTLEGVVGIARAFLGSGARAVLVSLWQVPDYATSCFMETFYKHLVNDKMSASKALHCTQTEMRRDFKHKQHRADEQDWAGFRHIGDDVTLD